jgi:hypothetical protein
MVWQRISPKANEGFYEVLYIQCRRTDDDLLRNGSEDGNSDTDW